MLRGFGLRGLAPGSRGLCFGLRVYVVAQQPGSSRFEVVVAILERDQDLVFAEPHVHQTLHCRTARPCQFISNNVASLSLFLPPSISLFLSLFLTLSLSLSLSLSPFDGDFLAKNTC